MVLLYFIADVERAKSESTLYDFRAGEQYGYYNNGVERELNQHACVITQGNPVWKCDDLLSITT